MESKIVERGELVLAGMTFYGDPFTQASAWDADNEVGALWKRFMGLLAAEPGAIVGRAGPADAMYELHVPVAETPRTGRYEVFVGVEVTRAAVIPLCCSLKVVPAGRYLLVTARGREISSDWRGRGGQAAGGAGSGAFVVEVYDGRFKGMDRMDESELDFLLPLEAQGPE
jgi:hypothetical protein